MKNPSLFPIYRISRTFLPENHKTHPGAVEVRFVPSVQRDPDTNAPEQEYIVAFSPSEAWRILRSLHKDTSPLALGVGEPLECLSANLTLPPHHANPITLR